MTEGKATVAGPEIAGDRVGREDQRADRAAAGDVEQRGIPALVGSEIVGRKTHRVAPAVAVNGAMFVRRVAAPM